MAATTALQAAAADGVNLLEVLQVNVDGKKLSPGYLHSAKGVLMLWGTKMGLGFGGRVGSGFFIARLREGRADGASWSAPLWLKVRVGEAGLCFGYAKIMTYMLAMSDTLARELEAGSHRLVGMDQTFTLTTADETKSDVIALASGRSDLVGSSRVSGVMMDFSFAGGSMTVDDAKMAVVYGNEASTHSVLTGQTPPPAEMLPLYAKLDHMEASVVAASPTLTRSSLQRMTAGYDPDRRMVSDTGELLHRGYSDQALAERAS